MTKPKLRCAIYTRKSSEEGLEQDFNSLDAQREACEAFIASQAGEGWTLVRTPFDDGGYSGGSIDRPGLKALLTAIDEGRVDVVVVYKVDRLTRSLSDFARIIERFDAKKISFVSVTQSFNTTTSMGRLTLNILLSFAQFEREVTGERIRDKLLASKKKGLWMGGTVPLGYDPDGRTLTINKKEAQVVRHIFERYIELKSVDDTVRDLRDRGIKSKAWISKTGGRRGGYAIDRGALRHLLQNPLYLGQIRHKDKVYAGQHKAIISQELWDEAQKTFEENRHERKAEIVKAKEEWWLTGKLFDAQGRPMIPTYTSRPNGKRYKYYFVDEASEDVRTTRNAVSRVKMELIHGLVQSAADRWLGKKGRNKNRMLTKDVQKVVLGRESVTIDLTRQHAEGGYMKTRPTKIDVPIRITRHGHRSEIIAPPELGLTQTNPKVVSVLRLAWQWRREIETGTYATPELLADTKGVSKRYVNKLVPLGFLEPAALKTMLS
ncbi:MAG: recombinase family protein [Rhodospirillaceae bacterium]|nr:recombinase family protein [Rhodospirillaceae bacterium]